MQLIDAGMLAFAAWHALKGRVDHPLTFQMPRMLRKLVQEAQDTYTLFWNGERLWKRDRWPSYRDRPEIWDEAGREDFDGMLEVLTGLGAVQYRVDDREADEILAALAHALEGTEPLVIRSDDKDFMQLLSPSTCMLGRVRGTVLFSDVEQKIGVPPEYVADYLALTGDKADDIPRIVTPSAAKRIISSHGHIAEWIDSEHSLGMGDALVEKRDQLRLNLELVDLSAASVGKPPPPTLNGWGVLDRARAVGKKLEITYLTEDTLEKEFATLRDWGQRTRERLS